MTAKKFFKGDRAPYKGKGDLVDILAAYNEQGKILGYEPVDYDTFYNDMMKKAKVGKL